MSREYWTAMFSELWLRMCGLKWVLACVWWVPTVHGKKRHRILCTALAYPQYEWANCTVGPKLKSVYWCTKRGYSTGEWGGDEGMWKIVTGTKLGYHYEWSSGNIKKLKAKVRWLDQYEDRADSWLDTNVITGMRSIIQHQQPALFRGSVILRW